MKTYIPDQKAVIVYMDIQMLAATSGLSLPGLAKLNGFEDSYSLLHAKMQNPDLKIKTQVYEIA